MAYQRKYGYDHFSLNCTNTTLNYFPNCMQALFIKFNTHQTFGLKYVEKFGKVPSDYIVNNHKQYKNTQLLVENLGYRELSPENYEKWLLSMEEEIEKQKSTP